MDLSKRKMPGSSRLAPPDAEGIETDRAGRLRLALHHSRYLMQPFRRQRTAMVRQFVGQEYGDVNQRRRTPVNLMRLATTIYRRQVAARAPQALVVPYDDRLAPAAEDLGLEINELLRRIDFETTLAQVVTQSMFGPGILKVGIHPKGDALRDAAGFRRDPGQPFADCVDIDNAVWDMRADSWDKVQFIGDSYELPLDALAELGIEDATPYRGLPITEYGDEKASSLQTQQWAAQRGYVDVARLWDVWCPLDRKVVTFLADDSGGFASARIVRVVDWKGPRFGPYHVLAFETPPSNLMPVAPVASLSDLHEILNGAFVKLANQVKRQKTVTTYQGDGQADAERVRDANDGDVLRVETEIDEHRFGGADGPSLAFFMQAKDLASWVGGNLDAIGGLSRVANTVGQESMIARASNMQIADMQETTMRFARRVLEQIAVYVLEDPVTRTKVRKTVPGTDHVYVHETGPDTREGTIDDYQVCIEPYSMQSRTPSERVAAMGELMTNFVIPMAPQLAAQGKTVDFVQFVDLVSRYNNMPELRQIVRDMTPQEKASSAAPAPGGDRPLQSPVTVRRNVRENVGGTGRAGQDSAAMDLLAMGRSNDA